MLSTLPSSLVNQSVAYTAAGSIPGQKQRWLPGMAAGDLIGWFGLPEPTAGSDPANMVTGGRSRRRRLGAERHQTVDRARDNR